MIGKLQRDFVAADLAAVETLLAQTGEADILTAMSLEARRDELRERLSALVDTRETRASVALFFSGGPVIGSRGIASEFAGTALAKYQDLVSKVYALRSTGNLRQKGVVPRKELAKLHITNIVHGSFGFQLEELDEQQALVETPLKDAVDQTVEIVRSFASEDEEPFISAVENIDQRVVSTVGEFFDILAGNDARLRLVSGEVDKSFDQSSVARAVDRAHAISVSEDTQVIYGFFKGALPDWRMFEFRPLDGQKNIRGKIPLDFPVADLETLNKEWVDKRAVATFLVKKVVRAGRIKKESYILTDLSAEDQS